MLELQVPYAQSVELTDDTLAVDLTDGRTISVPLAWFPRLMHGTAKERGHWRFIGQGYGIHWPDLDEDISVENLVRGQPSGESQQSLKRWLDARAGAKNGIAEFFQQCSWHRPESAKRINNARRSSGAVGLPWPGEGTNRIITASKATP